MRRSLKALPYAILLTAGSSPLVSAQEAVHQAVNMSLPLWSIIPFVALLLSVALVPLVNGLWWRKNEKWVALFWSVAFLVPFSYIYGWQEGLERFLEAVLLDFADPSCRDAYGELDRYDGSCDAAHPSFDPHQCMAPACFAHHGFPDFPRGEYGRVSYAAR